MEQVGTSEGRINTGWNKGPPPSGAQLVTATVLRILPVDSYHEIVCY